MNNQTAFLLGAFTCFTLCLIFTQCDRDKPLQPAKISESVILYEMAVAERKQAEKYLDSAARLQAKRDTLYITRTRTITKWDSLIRTLPPNEILPARLDSCIEVGQIVLGELASCDSVVEYQATAIGHLSTANDRLDSSRTELAGYLDQVNREVVKQRNGKRLAWVVVGIVAVAAIVF